MNFFKIFGIVTLCLVEFGNLVEPANIIGIYTADVKSHYLFAQNCLKELAKSGHNVTVFTGFQSDNLPSNYREVHLELGSLDEFKKHITKGRSWYNFLSAYKKYTDYMVNTTKTILQNDEMQSLIKSKANVDVILMNFSDNPVLYGLSKELRAPLVITSSQKVWCFSEHFTGTHAHDSFVTNPLLPLKDDMSFVDRLLNTVVNGIGRIMLRYLLLPSQNTFNETFPHLNSSFKETLSTSIQLMLVNTHFSLDRPLPYMTNTIEVGGMQIPEHVNPLPAPLKSFIDKAKDGIIYFCMGGTLQMKDLDIDKKRMIINGLKQTRLPVVIKWDDESTINELVPKDKFFVSNWLPQNDILAHPKVKAYVSHGGLLSTTEAVYHGVPIVGMPLFADQRMNIKKYLNFGIAAQVDYETLSPESLATTINKVVDNSFYAETAKELSVRYRDRPMSPVQTAKYWIEYVIRNKNKQFMISPAMKLTTVEYFNWDVYMTILATALICAYLSWKVFKWSVVKMYKVVFKRNGNKDQKLKKY